MPDDVAVAAPHRAPNDHAIVVGINGYQAGIPVLKGCVNDADLFHRWLVDGDGGGLDPANVSLIRAPAPPSGKPERAQIEDIILGYYAHLTSTGRRKGRRLYLYFAGHGVMPQSPNDEDCGLVMGNALMLSLRSLLGRTTAKRVLKAALFDEVVLFMDCCRQMTANVMAHCELPDIGDVSIAARIPFIFGLAAPWAMTAAELELPHPLDPTQGSLWQGVFTHALLRGLRTAVDQNGEVTSVSLKQFVRSAVQELLPDDDNVRPQIDLSENLQPISFGRGVRVRLEVRQVHPFANLLATVTVHDGQGLDVLHRSSQSDAFGLFSFDLIPARYLVVAQDAAGNVIGKRPTQLFGETVRVDF